MPAANGVLVQCHQCGKFIYRPPWRLKRTVVQFCDAKCRGAWQSTRTGENAPAWKGTQITVQCAQCRATVQRDPSKVERNDNFFCCRTCFDLWRKTHLRGANNPNWSEPVHTTCATCGKPIDRNPARVGVTERKVHFCSKPCRYEWMGKHLSGPNNYAWKGGIANEYGPNWLAQRRMALKRDAYRCQACGATRKQLGQTPDVHHIQPFRTFGYIPGANENYQQANELQNLICLCRSCHQKAEKGKLVLQPKLI